MTASTTHTYWQQSLAGIPAPIHENDPQPGYYRMRASRAGAWLPVAIWRDSQGDLNCIRDGMPVDPQDIWTWCCRNAVSYETYVDVAERGASWPDDVPAGIGHNRGEELDPLSDIMGDVAALADAASAWLEVKGSIASQEDADKAGNFAERFSALERKAEEARTREKKPILEQGRAIDAKWKPVVEAAANGKRRMKKSLEPWLLEERERALASQDQGSADVASPPRAGTSGRRVGLRVVRRLQVRDREALVKAYRRDPRFWSHRLVDEALRDLAEADLRTGRRVAGADLVEEHVAA